MTTRLVILGLLNKEELHGYEIKQIIEERMGDWTNIAFGSIYFAIGKLAEEGLIEKTAEEQEGRRPSRNVYRITKEGRKEFVRLREKAWTDWNRQTYPLDIALFFSEEMNRKHLLALIRYRLKDQRRAILHLREHRQEQLKNPEVPAIASAIFDHTCLHMRAEYRWLKTLYLSMKEENNGQKENRRNQGGDPGRRYR